MTYHNHVLTLNVTKVNPRKGFSWVYTDLGGEDATETEKGLYSLCFTSWMADENGNAIGGNIFSSRDEAYAYALNGIQENIARCQAELQTLTKTLKATEAAMNSNSCRLETIT